MGEVHGDAGEFCVAPFDLTRVEPDADVEADVAGGVANRRPAADRTGGSVEGSQHTVTGEVFFVTGEADHCRRTASSWRSSTACHARSPISTTRSVDATTSVNKKVASIRVCSTAA